MKKKEKKSDFGFVLYKKSEILKLHLVCKTRPDCKFDEIIFNL